MFFSRDPYRVLGITSDMSEQDRKSRYRQLCKIYHPDNSETGDMAKFKEINDAWKFINGFSGVQNSTPVKRVQRRWTHRSLFDVQKI